MVHPILNRDYQRFTIGLQLQEIITMAILTFLLLLVPAFALGDTQNLKGKDKEMMDNLIHNLPIEKQEPNTRSSSCPLGWYNYGTHCYHYISILATWPEAEHYCLQLGGNLASVHSLSQYNFLMTLIERNGRNQPTWIGAHDAVKEGVWLWSDGSRFNYKKWNRGEPNNQSPEHCMEMNSGAERGQNDKSCGTQRPFMCARKR